MATTTPTDLGPDVEQRRIRPRDLLAAGRAFVGLWRRDPGHARRVLQLVAAVSEARRS
jgi:hypothetical protein